MEEIMQYVKPELLVLTVVLYFIGVGLKHTTLIEDKFIPMLIGIFGIVLSAVYVAATCPLGTMQEIAMAIFTAIVQGILVAGLSTYVNQIFKQLSKTE